MRVDGRRHSLAEELEVLRRQVAELSQEVRRLREKERSLQESEGRHRLISKLVSDRIYRFVVGRDGKPRLTDPILGKVGEITGYGLDESREFEKWRAPIHQDDWPKFTRHFEKIMAGQKTEFELRLVSKEGEMTWHKVVATPEWDEEKGRVRGGIFCLKDITSEKRAEEQMVRLERLRALAQMSAGVSHNLNNILTTIVGPAKILEKELADETLLREVGYIIRSARRARELVQRLNQAVLGGVDRQPEPVSVSQVVGEAVRLTRPIWKDESESRGITIDVRTDLVDGPPVKATRSGLTDVVVNLLLNAIDALPNGGEIRVKARRVDGAIELVVSDNGVGMDETVRSRAFDPFFSTKSEVGTGLGLSTVQGSVTRWGGTIDLQSQPGAGTTFTIKLPLWDMPVAESAPERVEEPVRRAKILVVEDIEAVRSFLVRVLSKNHDVDGAPGAKEALKMISARCYDVAVVDLGLSGMPGDALGRLMKRQNPAIATVLVSGWALEDNDPRLESFDFSLKKPFEDLVELRNTVAKAVALHDDRHRKNVHRG